MLVQGIPVSHIVNSIIVIMKVTFVVFTCILKDVLGYITNLI